MLNLKKHSTTLQLKSKAKEAYRVADEFRTLGELQSAQGFVSVAAKHQHVSCHSTITALPQTERRL
jgi:hypothetical protein